MFTIALVLVLLLFVFTIALVLVLFVVHARHRVGLGPLPICDCSGPILFLTMMLFVNALVLKFKSVDKLSVQLEEVIHPNEPELEVDCCDLALISSVIASTALAENSTTKDVILLGMYWSHKKIFGKLKIAQPHLGLSLHLSNHFL
jgi:hypothetical protein